MHLTTKITAMFAGVAAGVVVAVPADAAPAPDTVEVANVAHRGASAYAPENTLAAVREGINMDSDLIEVDVQRTKDGELVLIHDTNLARTTDVEQVYPDRAPWRVADFTYDEILQLDAGSWKSPKYAGEKIPTLTETIEVIRRSSAGLLLEVKAPELYPGIEAEIARTMRALPGYVESAVAAELLVVQSFNFSSMAIFKELEPTVPVGLLGTPAATQLPELAAWADQINPHHKSVGADYVEAVHEAGMDCLVWTVDAVPDMDRAIDMGVDGVITNRPDVFEQVLHDRLRPAA